MSLIVATPSGKLIDLHALHPNDIKSYDIALSLSKLARYNGATKRFYSVAEHCVRLATMENDTLSQRDRLALLLHDAAEAYIGDIVRPVKHMIREDSIALDTLEAYVARRIYEAYNVDYAQHKDAVETLDADIARAEMRELYPPHSEAANCLGYPNYAYPKAMFLPHSNACEWFLKILDQLTEATR